MVMVWNCVCEVIDGGPLSVTVARLSKTRLQEKKYHKMIGEIAKQVRPFGKYHAQEVWKALLVDQYEQELLASGEALTHPGETVVSMDGQRQITIRPSTTKFRKAEGSGFIEFLYAQGCEMGVVWTEPCLEIYNEYAAA